MSNVNKKVCDTASNANVQGVPPSLNLVNLVSVNASSVTNDKFSLDRRVVNARTNIKSPCENYRSVYVTRFDRSTTVAHIIEHLKQFDVLGHFIGQIRCSRLAPRHGKYSFVSFKIDVPENSFAIITNNDLWPSGITVSEFEKRPRPNQHQKSPQLRRNATPIQNASRPKNGTRTNTIETQNRIASPNMQRTSRNQYHQVSRQAQDFGPCPNPFRRNQPQIDTHTQCTQCSNCSQSCWVSDQPRSVQARLQPYKWNSAPQPNRVSRRC